MAKAGQHHNDGVSSSKPRGHEQSRGERPVTTTGSPRARESDISSGRSGSDSNQDAGTRGH
jgi:hypothetical protein